MASEDTKIILRESEMPQRWYNILPDLPRPLPPALNPQTNQPLGPADLAPLFPMGLIMQEVSMEPEIDIPSEVQRIYRLWRPSPLYRARSLEKALKTPARIYYKNESFSPAGSHKPNTAVPQAYYNKLEGVKRLATETGAGQWGSALAFACSQFDLKCTVYMVKVSYEQKPYRRMLMHTWGATVHASPSRHTHSGAAALDADPETSGSLGMAISEAVEDAATHEDTRYALGSVLNHVMLHQTVIGLEAKEQLRLVDETPDVIVGCVGGGSNFSGLAFPFMKDKMGGKKIDILAVEPEACPTLTRGLYAYDYGDTAKLAPIVKMYTLGHGFMPEPIHAGGLRYHGDSPILSLLVAERLIEPRACHQLPTFEAALTWARTEGSLPAPETAHALRVGIDEAVKCRETGEAKCILIGYSGHGFFDLGSYERYFSGKLEDYEYPQEKIDEALKDLPYIPNQ